MKITVIYSNARKETTHHCVQIFKDALLEQDTVEFVEFVLPHDMPHACTGCFSCFEKGAETCPHAAHVQPIAEALLASDGIILSSPVFALSMSGAMKSLMDHLCFLWISHRPDPAMFSKTAMVITTTAGAGVRGALKALAQSPRYWGVKRVLRFGIGVQANRWADVSPRKRARLTKALRGKARAFMGSMRAQPSRYGRPLVRLMFPMMRRMIARYDPNGSFALDRAHWAAHGWLDGERPYGR